MIVIYRILFPFAFLVFLPGLVWKLIRRSGYKKTYLERIAVFGKEKKEILKQCRGAIWVHAVSVGETNLALTTLNRWIAQNPDRKFILSTTTTTGQEIARKKAPEGVEVIFCPIDAPLFVGRTLKLLKPSALIIFETELWPNLVLMAKKQGVTLMLLNARISDKSLKGYKRYRRFFAPILEAFTRICVQSELDKERFLALAPSIENRMTVCGNIKFDQEPPKGDGFNFGTTFGPGNYTIITAASTHSPEEKLIVDSFAKLKPKYPDIRLVIVPRHAERGNEVEKWIQESGLKYHRRSTSKEEPEGVDVLLADTTGELASILKSTDIVIMGKTLCGNDEGQSIIEPAVMGKAIISGPKLKNFRQALDILTRNNGVHKIQEDSELPGALELLLTNPDYREELGKNAESAIAENRGALHKTIEILEETL